MFRGIAKDELDFFFEEAWHLLEPAANRNLNYCREGVNIGLKREELQLWCAFDGEMMKMAVITEIADFWKRRVCLILLLGGENREEWLKYLNVIELWAKTKGAEVVRIEGREGWARVLPDYTRISVVLEKGLNHA